MYAIISDGGRQYKVQEGLELAIDFRGVTPGKEITFDQVLAVNDGASLKLGSPGLAGASVTAQVLGIEQGSKLHIQKFRRRKNYRRKTGHRQLYTRIRISKIAV